MSVQFGKCNFDGKLVDPKDLDEVRPVLAPYGPDGEGYICKGSFGILYRALYTTTTSHREAQPFITRSGSVVTWDGRLDNREELISVPGLGLSNESTDVEIVAEAYIRWGTGAYARIVGDWALSIWDPETRCLILAKDFAGTRHLYYCSNQNQVTWCTILDPLVLFAEHSLQLEEEYLAGWLSMFPAVHLTPYQGIHAVPPSSFVRLTADTQTVRKYWDFDSERRIRHRTDAEYEEHFRHLLTESVRRRLRSNWPVLAELSGGIDSSSIVCLADKILLRGACETPRLDTVSYFDESQPNWNERPYFSQVEQQRGRVGCHIDVSDQARRADPDRDTPYFNATPADTSLNRAKRQLMDCMTKQGNRVLLSGFGGDEVTGGVPIPGPELMDLIVGGRIRKLAGQLKLWALEKRKPWLHLFCGAVKGFLPAAMTGGALSVLPESWLRYPFLERNRAVLSGYRSRIRLFGPLPSFQENLSTLDALRRQLAFDALPARWACERRYPYLDRDLLEFLFAIPREQLLRPGQRRSLMRRALAGIVPDGVLQRKRKAFLSRSSQPVSPRCSDGSLLMADLGLVDAPVFAESVRAIERGTQPASLACMQALALEAWLRHLRERQILTMFEPAERGLLRIREMACESTFRL